MTRAPVQSPPAFGSPRFDARAIARGRRFVGWLTGTSPFVWIDKWPGALCARVATAIGLPGQPVCTGPIFSRRTWHVPPLSWFRIPPELAVRGKLPAAIGKTLDMYRDALPDARVHSLMQRVLTTDALHVRRRVAGLPAMWRAASDMHDASDTLNTRDARDMRDASDICDTRATRAAYAIRTVHAVHAGRRIVLIDERDTSYADICTARARRRAAFVTMIETARAAHPGAALWVLRSADAGAGNWLSAGTMLFANVHAQTQVQVLAAAHSFAEILAHAHAVYTVGASEGMAALLAAVPVYTFGTPYYAGWGLTRDHARMPERTARPTLAAFFDATFLRLAGYLDPQSGAPGTLDAALDCVELQHTVAARYRDLERMACVGFQWWKRKYATPYLSAGGGTLRWVSGARDIQRDTCDTPNTSDAPDMPDTPDAPDTPNVPNVRAGECVALWGARPASGLRDGVRHVRIEDGFIHSTGLGSDLSPPCSQIIDRRGLYFDASRPSDLTLILNTATFDDAELARAAALRREIVRCGLTKYNLGRRAPAWRSFSASQGRRIVLVAGQVEDDASIRLGTLALTTSSELLRAVRAQRPDAFIVYKPHPDVLSGNRAGLVDAGRLADVVDTGADLVSLIEVADELHTLSSLAGFDALMREKPVFTYGLPFYAGWGLTHDALAQPWRARRLSLDMLTAGALLRYPLYWDWQLSLFTTPEAIVHQLAGSAARSLGKISANRARPFMQGWRWSRNAASHAVWRSRRFIAQQGIDEQDIDERIG